MSYHNLEKHVSSRIHHDGKYAGLTSYISDKHEMNYIIEKSHPVAVKRLQKFIISSGGATEFPSNRIVDQCLLQNVRKYP